MNIAELIKVAGTLPRGRVFFFAYHRGDELTLEARDAVVYTNKTFLATQAGLGKYETFSHRLYFHQD